MDGSLHTRQPVTGVPSNLLFTLSLLLISFLLFVSSAKADTSSSGSGIFQLTLEEALEIEVVPTEHVSEHRDGLYRLSSYELARLYQRELGSNVGEEASFDKTGQTQSVPVFIRGQYFANFTSIRDAVRFIRSVTEESTARIDLHRGRQTQWFEEGRYHTLLDIQADVRFEFSGTPQSNRDTQPSNKDITVVSSNSEVLP